MTALSVLMGNSGLVTVVGSENDGTARSTRALSGASLRRVSLLSLSSGGCGIVLELGGPAPALVDGEPAARGPGWLVQALARSATTMVSSTTAGGRAVAGRRVAPCTLRDMASSRPRLGQRRRWLRSGDDLDQTQGLARALDRHLGDLTDAPDVGLVVQDAWFQGGGLRGAQGVAERAEGHGDRRGAADHREHVLGVALVPLLAEPAADLGVGLHEDTGLGAVDPGVEGPLGADDVAVAVQLGGVLAEVPDVAAAVLGVVVAGPLFQDVVQIQPVGDHPRGHPVDRPGPCGGGDQVERLLAVLGAGVDQGLAWGERKQLVGDVGGEACRVDVGMVAAAGAEPWQGTGRTPAELYLNLVDRPEHENAAYLPAVK